jgi:signal transduction histidine kinase
VPNVLTALPGAGNVPPVPRMNQLPRFLAFALFVVLAALVVALTAAVWRSPRREAPPSENVASAGTATGAAARVWAATARVALILAVVSLALALTLIGSLALHPRLGETRSPVGASRNEMGTLVRLAQTSVAQDAELHRERDVRRRAEEDAHLQQQRLAQSLDEKIRLGRDLHDGIIQSLYAVGLTLEAVRALIKTDPAEADRRLEQTRAGLNATIRDVRAYISGLAPERVRSASFGQALEAALAELRAGREIQFDITVDDEAAAQLTAEQAVEALQIAREAASNALRHGGASIVTLRVHQGDRAVCLLVQDNGAGFEAGTPRAGGHGLANMRARAERIGATLRVTSRPGEGTRIVATLPLLHADVV